MDPGGVDYKDRHRGNFNPGPFCAFYISTVVCFGGGGGGAPGFLTTEARLVHTLI